MVRSSSTRRDPLAFSGRKSSTPSRSVERRPATVKPIHDLIIPGPYRRIRTARHPRSTPCRCHATFRVLSDSVLGPGSSPPSGWRLVTRGERTLNVVPLPRLADDLDRSPMSAHDAEYRGQTQTTPRELGREERIEDFRPAFPGTCRSRCRPLPGRHTPLPGGICLEVRSPDRYARSQCMTPVLTAITPLRSPIASEALMIRFMTICTHLDRVRLDCRAGRAGAKLYFQQTLLGDRDLQETGHVLRQVGEVEMFDAKSALAGVGQHLLGKFGRPARAIHYLGDQAAERPIPAATPSRARSA